MNMLSTDKLRDKEVINICDGRSIGFVSDIEVNLESGTIEGIVIPAQRRIFRILANQENDLVIKWDKVKTVGEDVILVEMEPY